jgi:hypothetical protein
MSDLPAQTSPQVFRRGAFHTAFRWVALLIFVGMNIACIAMTVQYISQHGATPQYIGKLFISYLFLMICNVAILPSIILEAQKIEVFDDRLVIHNLLYRTAIQWSDIKKVVAPLYLKFAIIRTPKWFALINKRDVERFSDLIQIIRDKADAASSS